MDCITAAPNCVCLKTMHKIGVRVPKTVMETIQVNQENSKIMWQDIVKIDECSQDFPQGFGGKKVDPASISVHRIPYDIHCQSRRFLA